MSPSRLRLYGTRRGPPMIGPCSQITSERCALVRANHSSVLRCRHPPAPTTFCRRHAQFAIAHPAQGRNPRFKLAGIWQMSAEAS